MVWDNKIIGPVRDSVGAKITFATNREKFIRLCMVEDIPVYGRLKLVFMQDNGPSHCKVDLGRSDITGVPSPLIDEMASSFARIEPHPS